MSESAELRALAARVIADVSAGAALDAALAGAGKRLAESEGRSRVKAWCYGTLRSYHRLRPGLGRLLRQPLRARERVLEGLLLVGLFQLLEGSTPAHAAVSETVEAAPLIGRERARSLVNAVLRRFLRERTELLAAVDRSESARFAHPEWLIAALRRDWPQDWPAILEAGNAHPPMWLRVNARRQTPGEYLRALAAAGLEASSSQHAPEAVRLMHPVEVNVLPGFAAGSVSVQDAAAQLAAHLLDVRPGMRVLDACAAPGGKTCHVLETVGDLAELVAVDCEPARLALVRDNLRRLALTATVVEGDASAPTDWWDARPFDRILLDVPCSGTGVIRRHPDIKLLRRAGDIDSLAERQAGLLEALWPLLAPAGRLLYSSCSVLRAENEQPLERFCRQHPDALCPRPGGRAPGRGRSAGAGRQSLPGAAARDGFYYAVLQKRS